MSAGLQPVTAFEFATAQRIVFGAGKVAEAGRIAAELGRRALVVTGHDSSRAEPVLAGLREHGLGASVFAVAGEPHLDTVERGAGQGRRENCDLVISIGGGSAIDTGKAIAAMLTNPGSLLDYVEIIGHGKPLTKPSAHFLAIPTTAGTGSEATRNAVLASPEQRVKVSLRSPLMLPTVALVDPQLGYDLPPALTASIGLDALTQVIEPFVCSRANPLIDALCRQGIRRAARSLRVACDTGNHAAAREDMALASLYSGIALANAGLGAVHGFAGPIGGMFPAPHGAVCAALLPGVMEANLRALRERSKEDVALMKYDEVGRLLTGSDAAGADAGVDFVRKLVADLHIPPLSAYGIKREHAAEIVGKAQNASSMKANPIRLTPEELQAVLVAAM